MGPEARRCSCPASRPKCPSAGAGEAGDRAHAVPPDFPKQRLNLASDRTAILHVSKTPTSGTATEERTPAVLLRHPSPAAIRVFLLLSASSTPSRCGVSATAGKAECCQGNTQRRGGGQPRAAQHTARTPPLKPWLPEPECLPANGQLALQGHAGFLGSSTSPGHRTRHRRAPQKVLMPTARPTKPQTSQDTRW